MSRNSTRKRPLAAFTSLIVLFALAIPWGGAAFATHTSVDAEPENDRNAVGSQHTITVTTSNANQEVNFDVQGPGDPANNPSDFECQTDADAPFTCEYTYTSNTAGTDAITIFSDEGTDNDAFNAGEPDDQVQKVWVAAADIRVDCTPDEDANPEGFTHTMTCTMDDGMGPVSGGQLDAEFLPGSANDPPAESGAADLNDLCGTEEPVAGQCTFGYTGANPGTDEICFFVDEDANTDMDDADCTTEAAQGVGSGVDDTDDADVVQKTWVRQAQLDIEPESGSSPNAATQTLTAMFFDQIGNPIALPEGQLVDFEIIAGPNANLSPPATLGFRDFECPSNLPTPGNECTASYTDSPTSGSGIDVICAWISHDGDDDTFDPNGAPEEGGDCDTEAPSTVDNDETDVVFRTFDLPPQCQAVGAILGTSGHDSLTGTPNDDVLCGLGGNDTVMGGGGEDVLYGHAGNDTLWGGVGDDVLHGHSGNDTLWGHAGNDTLGGYPGNDTLWGHAGNDTLKGHSGNDSLSGGPHVDSCYGGSGVNEIILC